MVDTLLIYKFCIHESLTQAQYERTHLRKSKIIRSISNLSTSKYIIKYGHGEILHFHINCHDLKEAPNLLLQSSPANTDEIYSFEWSGVGSFPFCEMDTCCIVPCHDLYVTNNYPYDANYCKVSQLEKIWHLHAACFNLHLSLLADMTDLCMLNSSPPKCYYSYYTQSILNTD